MSLGRQFENTYWEDPTTGDTHTWTRGPSSDMLPNHRPIHQTNAEPSTEQPLQGLLFHPLTGTGLSGDPMSPPEVRRGIIQKALNLTNVEQYKKNLSGILGLNSRYRGRSGVAPTRANISDTVAESHMERLTDTLEGSEMPTHMIASRVDKPVTTVLDPIPGRAWAEANGSAIRMTMPQDSGLRTVSSVEKVKVPSTEPIANPKFWDQLTAARNRVERGDNHNSISADVTFEHATHWINPTTGHVMTKEFAEKLPIDYSANPPGEAVENGLETPGLVLKTMGYVPNLFPGKGKPESKTHAVGKNVKIETGYGSWDSGRDYTEATFHQRFKAGEQEEERVVHRQVREQAPLSETTMTHELGHAMDPNISETITHRGTYETSPGRILYWVDPNEPGGTKYYGRAKHYRSSGLRPIRGTPNTASADPIEEAVADAYADRYTRYKGQFTDTLADVEGRVRDFKRTGYTVGYSGWKNDLHRALYVATRYHTALSDDQPQQIPSREAVLKGLPKSESKNVRKVNMGSDNEYLDTVNKLVLGHMWHHMPHIRGVIKQAGYEKAALGAHAEYKKRMGLDKWSQPTLPGMEKFA